MIDPADFEKYLQLEAEAEALKQKMIVHAQKVAVTLYGATAKITGFGRNSVGKGYAYGYVSDDEGLHIPMEMLFRADWEVMVAERHEKQRIRSEKLTALWEKERKQAEADKDLKELDRLKQKYPDKV